MQITSSRLFISLSVSLVLRSREIQEREGGGGGGGGGGVEGGRQEINEIYFFIIFDSYINSYIYCPIFESFSL